MAASTKKQAIVPAEFINSLKARIPINEFYTKITGENFTRIDSRLRAKARWREDAHESLCYYERSNTLTDFADKANYKSKIGKVYNHIDLLLVTKICKSFYDAVVYLANYLGETLQGNLLKQIQAYTKYQDTLDDVYLACRNTMLSLFKSDVDPRLTQLLRAYCKIRCIPWDRDFFDVMDLGIWPARAIIEAIGKKYDIETDKQKAEMSLMRFHDWENMAIVFPLYNKHGALVGLRARVCTDAKEIQTYVMDNQNIAMYGLNKAISWKHVNIVEGEMNRLQCVAALWEKHRDKALMTASNTFCTGSVSVSARLKAFANHFDRVNYFPDVQLLNLNQADSRCTVDNVLDVYNSLQAISFNTFYWPDQKDKYDVDDYLREHIDDRAEAFFNLVKTKEHKCDIAEFLRRTIEDLVVLNQYSDEAKDSARFAYQEQFKHRLWNTVDKNKLAYLYKHITNVDDDILKQIISSVFVQISDSKYYTKDNCYYVEEMDKASGALIKSKISEFIVRGLYKMVSMRKIKQSAEDAYACGEATEIHAEIIFSNSRKVKHTIFTPEDFSDFKRFWNTLFCGDIDLASSVKKDRESDVFFCVKNTASVSLERCSFGTPGPHMRNFNPETESITLRPNLFQKGGTLKTYLNKHVSIIDGKIMENSQCGIDLVKAQQYCFELCTDEEFSFIADIVWNDLRKLHDPVIIDGLLGYTFCGAIKHLLDPNVNGLILSLLGKSNSHKTSIARIAQNFFGNFATDDQVKAFSNSTPKYLSAAIQASGSCMCVCDEFKPGKEFTIEAMNHLVHNVVDGKDRGRLTAKGEMVDPNLFYTNLVTTAEYNEKLETSAEARYIRFLVPAINTEEIFKKINSQPILSKFKTFTPRLIAWQHNNIEQLQEQFERYKKNFQEVIKDESNSIRIAMQLSMIITGFYSLCKFLESKGVCKAEDSEFAIQRLYMHMLHDAKMQAARATDTRAGERFLEYLRGAIETRKLNVSIIEYGDDDKYCGWHYAIQNFQASNLWKFRRKPTDPSSTVYAIVHFKAMSMELGRMYNYTFADSLIFELAEEGFVKLDERGVISAVRIPNFENPGQMKLTRAVLIPESKLFNEKEEVYDDREPEGI